jgi:hypothetical protein
MPTRREMLEVLQDSGIRPKAAADQHADPALAPYPAIATAADPA